MMANPWDSEPSFINHGGLNQILLTNRKICSDKSSHPNNESSNHSSVYFINVLRELTSLNKEQVKVSLELKQRQLHQEFFNILSTDVLDGLISMVDFLSSHMQNIIDQKGQIIHHLHEPFVGKPLAIEAEYHSDVCKFFPLIAKQLAELSSTLNNIEWVNKYSVQSSNLGSTLDVIGQSLISLERQYNSIMEVRDLMNKRLNMSSN